MAIYYCSRHPRWALPIRRGLFVSPPPVLAAQRLGSDVDSKHEQLPTSLYALAGLIAISRAFDVVRCADILPDQETSSSTPPGLLVLCDCLSSSGLSASML